MTRSRLLVSIAALASAAAAIVVAGAASGGSAQAADQAALARFADQLEQAAQTADFVGLAVAVVDGGDIVLTRTYGHTELDGVEPITPYTVFPVASVSKGFAATLTGLLAHEGSLDLQAPIATYAPEFKLRNEVGGRKATIDYVLSHRLGLPPNAYDNLLEADVPVNDIVSRLRGVKTVCRLGDCYSYQNVAYNLLTPAIESADARPYADALQERIFDPLYMTSATVGFDRLTESDSWAKPHARRNATSRWHEQRVTSAYHNTPAAGGVNATIDDMALWLIAQMGHAEDVIPAEVLAEIHAPRVTSPRETRRWRWLRGRIKRTHYGYGWRVYDYAGRTAIAHSGGIRGFRSQVAFLPEEDVGLVAMWNSTGNRGWGLMPTLFDAYLGLEDANWLKLDTAEEPDLSGG